MVGTFTQVNVWASVDLFCDVFIFVNGVGEWDAEHGIRGAGVDPYAHLKK